MWISQPSTVKDLLLSSQLHNSHISSHITNTNLQLCNIYLNFIYRRPISSSSFLYSQTRRIPSSVQCGVDHCLQRVDNFVLYD